MLDYRLWNAEKVEDFVKYIDMTKVSAIMNDLNNIEINNYFSQ